MSKLATLLRRTTRTDPTPMGFSVGAGRAKSTAMLISIALSDPSLDAAVAAVDAGADTLLLDGPDLHDDAERIRAITAGVQVPCGLRLNKAASAAGAITALGLDYLHIENHETAAALLLDEAAGFVLATDGEASDTFLRLLDTMPFDALYAGEVGEPFTIRRMLELRRLSGLSRKPLLVQAGELNTADLECLRDSGVAAVQIEGGKNLSKRLGALRKQIEAMPPRRRRRNDRQEAVPLLPNVSHGGDDEGDDEE